MTASPTSKPRREAVHADKAPLYYLVFNGEPRDLLARLPARDFLLVDEDHLTACGDADISKVVCRVRDMIAATHRSVPVAGHLGDPAQVTISKRPSSDRAS